MLQLNDYECSKCFHQEEHYIDNNVDVKCHKCGGIMKKLLNAMRFELKYDPKKDVCAWGNEGYAASQYWRDVKKARDEGHKVKGANEA